MAWAAGFVSPVSENSAAGGAAQPGESIKTIAAVKTVTDRRHVYLRDGLNIDLFKA